MSDSNGTTIQGSVGTQGGDFVGRDQVNIGLNVQDLVAALRQAFPAGDPRPEQVRQALLRFNAFHQALYEWKELHNALDEILNAFAPFMAQMERAQSNAQELNLDDLRSLWRPVSARVDALLDFGQNIQHIGTRYQPGQTATGEKWALELADLRRATSRLLGIPLAGEGDIAGRAATRTGSLQRFGLLLGSRPDWWPPLYELTQNFNSAAYLYMHLADKKLRDTATELYILSKSIFGSAAP
ncbi:MAG TPA: hypothetical protein PKL11_03325 [Anaerolineaceae bacterium]|nr:hypothetical protein [Anaerolineaceae bacterium]HOG78803.1 hypothetical protein [Anaerolineaceae bacterium]HQF62192.1 hypothetical protein [Anaerolineaceae bacterium]HQH84733.1 hypothetical protein [Anaerolineaceae bacterium]